MKSIGINSPCSENWNEMTANKKGAFCQKCASQVHDFTKKTSAEIKETLRELIGQSVCGRMTQKQEDDLNAEFEAWANRQTKHSFQQVLVFTLLVVFGLSLFSCENQQDQQKIEKLQQSVMKVVNENPIQSLFSEVLNLNQAETEQYVTMGEVVMPHDYIEDQQVVDEQKIMGDMAMPYDFINEEKAPEIIQLTEIEKCYIKGEISIAGGISSIERYNDYLIDTVKPTSINEKQLAIAFPNPSSQQTTLELDVPSNNLFEINLLDLSGKIIQKIHSGQLEKGTFRKEIDLSELNAGVYLIVIHSNEVKETVRVVKN